jgi:hypothetical protein
MVFFVQSIFAQVKTISGTVTEQGGLLLPGVSVIIQGTSIGGVTDFDGKYSFEVEDIDGKKLVFSFVGFKTSSIVDFLMRELYHYLGDDFEWKKPPYEYNYDQQPIDIINGTDKLRHWVENNDPIEKLGTFENLTDYKNQFEDIKIY